MNFSKITQYSFLVWFSVNFVMALTNFTIQTLLFAQAIFYLDIFLMNLLSTLIMTIFGLFLFKKILPTILKKTLIDNIKKLLLMASGFIFFIVSNLTLKLFLIGITGSLEGIRFSIIPIISMLIGFMLVVSILPLPSLPKEELEEIDHLVL